MEQVSPTRTELLTCRAQIRLAQQGAKLLRGKREALVREFLAEIRTFKADREAMLKLLTEAGQSLIRALSMDGEQTVHSVALASGRPVSVEIVERNIWGTKVADVESAYHARRPGQHGYALLSTTARVDETVSRFEQSVESIIKVAPKFHKLGRLAEEIRKTTRRVNALEQRLLPSLEEQVRYIRSVLDQREREDIFRLKRIKHARTTEE